MTSGNVGAARVFWRALRFVLLLAWGFVRAGYLRLRLGRYWHLTPRGSSAIGTWMKQGARILGLKIRVSGRPVDGPVLMVANHISWLDIVAMNAVAPAVFLAKGDVRAWPAIGWLAEMAGTLFIDRGSKKAVNEAVDQASSRLALDARVAIFPEGTTSDGHAVGPFHGGLFEAAVQTRCTIQPVALYYGPVNGRLSVAPFVGEDDFVSHLLRVLRVEAVYCHVTYLPPLSAAHTDRRMLAHMAHAHIERALGLGRAAA